MYTSLYSTPSTFDDIILVADGDYLTGLYFIHSQEGKRYLKDGQEANLPVFQDTRRWLDSYFSGHLPTSLHVTDWIMPHLSAKKCRK